MVQLDWEDDCVTNRNLPVGVVSIVRLHGELYIVFSINNLK